MSRWQSGEWLPAVERAESVNPVAAAWLRERCETVDALMKEGDRLMRSWRLFIPGSYHRAMRLLDEADLITDDIRRQAQRMAEARDDVAS